ncbi:MAG: hypothetical protein DHS20C20_05560 [Ardenticatenaceae bacterium]|nr:MAG: hypothetical protein DHS20C20_05560 [Ardenticatenaceae bacterium]
MSDSVIIQSTTASNALIFSEPEGLKHSTGTEYFRATITCKNLSASSKIYAFQPYKHITELFEHLATNWQGWNGEEEWVSLEGELTLTCVWQKTGKVKFSVTLLSGHYEDDWTIQTQLFVEPSQLDDIAFEMRNFFGKPG